MESKDTRILWRQTFEDDAIPFFNYIDYKNELQKKELKNYKTVEEMAAQKFLTSNDVAKKKVY